MTVLLTSQTASERVETDEFRKIADHLLGYTDLTGYELSILLVDDRKMTELNTNYRQKGKPTNVLSFPMLEPEEPDMPNLLGDIVISVETAAREARQQKVDLGDYLGILLVHGFVHLMGYDHEEGEEEAGEMVFLEKKFLEKLEKDGLIDSKGGSKSLTENLKSN